VPQNLLVGLSGEGSNGCRDGHMVWYCRSPLTTPLHVYHRNCHQSLGADNPRSHWVYLVGNLAPNEVSINTYMGEYAVCFLSSHLYPHQTWVCSGLFLRDHKGSL
jgi:hypothetical protein